MVDIAPLPPDQRPASMTPPQQEPVPEINPYEFITNVAPPSVGPSKKQRIMVVGIIAAVILTLGAVLLSVLSSAGGGPKDLYLKVLQQQAQLTHVSEIGEKQARETTARNLAVTARLSVSNASGSITALAKKAGAPVDKKVIALGIDKDIDKSLADADLNNRFDEVFIETMQELLIAHQKDLKALYDQSASASDKRTIQQAYNSIQQLITDNKPAEINQATPQTQTAP